MGYGDVRYEIPADLIGQKQKVTVRFRGNGTGAVLGIRMVRADALR